MTRSINSSLTCFTKSRSFSPKNRGGGGASGNDTKDTGGGGGGGGGFAGLGAGAGNGSRMGGRGGGLTGTIESVTDGLITVDTPQGPLQATIGSDPVIRSLVEVSVEDLVIDKRVTVTGERSEDGIIKANSILIRPGGSGFGGAGTSN